MQVTEKLTLREYDEWTQVEKPKKVPDPSGKDWKCRLGDAVYDYSEDPPAKRPGPHGEGERETDLSGKYALLSEHFYYFGDHPEPLPDHLLGIIKRGPGHRSHGNAPYVKPFVEWIESLGIEPNVPHGNPQLTSSISVSGLSIGLKSKRNLKELRRESG